jgi:hypothetical protein
VALLRGEVDAIFLKGASAAHIADAAKHSSHERFQSRH